MAVMKETGADVLLATTPENVIYLSDFDPWIHRVYKGNTSKKGTQIYALLTKEGAGALVGVSPWDLSYMALQPSWMEDVYAVGFGPQGAVPPLDLPSGKKFSDDVYRLQKLTSSYGAKA